MLIAPIIHALAKPDDTALLIALIDPLLLNTQEEQQLVSQQGTPLTPSPIYFEPDGSSATLGAVGKGEVDYEALIKVRVGEVTMMKVRVGEVTKSPD